MLAFEEGGCRHPGLCCTPFSTVSTYSSWSQQHSLETLRCSDHWFQSDAIENFIGVKFQFFWLTMKAWTQNQNPYFHIEEKASSLPRRVIWAINIDDRTFGLDCVLYDFKNTKEYEVQPEKCKSQHTVEMLQAYMGIVSRLGLKAELNDAVTYAGFDLNRFESSDIWQVFEVRSYPRPSGTAHVTLLPLPCNVWTK